MGIKIAVLGGGGVRTPMLVTALLERAQAVALDEIVLMDLDREKLELIGGLSRGMAAWMGSPIPIHLTDDPRRALESASYIITTIRVGGDAGRVLDERIALEHGVLGQETTGAGGLAMAMRSIPAIIDYAGLAGEIAPGAWILNFTNPAGLVTQALRDSGFARTVGICDSANAAQNEAAAYLQVPAAELTSEVFGLNHLSWTRRVNRDGRDVLPELLRADSFWAHSSQNIFDRELVLGMGMFLNEYLFYYYYSDVALARIRAEKMTRGEEIQALNRGLLEGLRQIDPTRDPDAAFQAYAAYERRRSGTYMQYARRETAEPAAPADIHAGMEEVGGYAGVALDVIEALETGRPLRTALNVPNQGALRALEPGDVVEISCRVDRSGIHPLPIGEVPEPQDLLMRQVKLYERQAAAAVLTRSRKTAALSLIAHPLVQSYPLACRLVDEYLAAHAAYIGEWS